MAPPRDAWLRIRLSSAELNWFHSIAEQRGQTLSELVRLSVAAEGAREGVPIPVKAAA